MKFNMSQSSQPPAVPHHNFGGEGPILHFSAANGYPPLTYRAFLEPLSKKYEVIASLHRPLWQPSIEPTTMDSWEVFGEDLLHLLAKLNNPVVSIGHSMGAVAILMAAVKRPELFKSIVLIEPVLLPYRYLLAFRFFSRFSPNTIPLVKKTLARVDRFSSREEAFAQYRPKQVFKKISDEVLWDYVLHGTSEISPGVFQLSYSKAWEARCYTKAYNLWRLLPSLKVPTLAIRAQNSNTLQLSSWQKWKSMTSTVDFIEIEAAGHLVPFEQPDQLAATISSWLTS